MEEYTLCGLETATSATFMIVGYILGNGDFCQIYDCWVYPRKWRLLLDSWLVGFIPKEWLLHHQRRHHIGLTPISIRLLGSYPSKWFNWWPFILSSGLIDVSWSFQVVWWMGTSVSGLINSDFCLWFDWWRRLPVVWLMGFIPRNGDCCLWFN